MAKEIAPGLSTGREGNGARDRDDTGSPVYALAFTLLPGWQARRNSSCTFLVVWRLQCRPSS
jgi:hypothetical protein